MRKRIREWLLAAFRRAPMGLLAGVGWATAGGTALIGNQALESIAQQPWWFWPVWWITLVGGSVLLLRGLIGILGYLGQQTWLVGSRAAERGLPRIRVEWPNLRTYPPTVTVARDPKWERGDQLMFEGLSLLDEVRKGGDREEQASAWLDDVREFLKTYNPQAWAAFDAPTGLLPYRSSGTPRDIVDLATTVDRALFLIRQTNPRVYGRAHLAQGGGS